MRCQGRRAPRPSAQATGGAAPSPEPRGPRSARSHARQLARADPSRRLRRGPATPGPPARHAPCPRAARPPAGGGLTSRGQSGEGARSPPAARAHGRSAAARPRRPAAAARFWGRALLGGGGSPRGPGGEAGERGGGGERGSGRRGERGREGGPNPEREKRGEGEKQKGKKGPESAPRCGLRATSPRPAWSSARPALLASLLPVCASPGRRALPPRVPAAGRAPCPQGLRSPAGIFVCGARART